MVDLATLLTQTTFDHPDVQIWTAEALTIFKNGAGGTLQKHLYLKSLSLRAAPDVDSAEFEFRTGVQVFTDEAAFTANALLVSSVLGKAVKVKIPDTVNTDPDLKKDIIWFGWIDTTVSDGVSQGTLNLQAAGVMIMAARHEVHTSVTRDKAGTGVVNLGVGLPFNLDSNDQYGIEGNRAPIAIPTRAYLYSWESRGASVWTSYTAVEYLLERQAPANYAGRPAPKWVYDAATARDKPNDWYRCRIETQGKSLKTLLDELIPRKRAMSYYAAYDDVTQTIKLRVFTFVSDSIILYVADDGTTQKLPRNADQVTVTLRDSVWFDDHKLTESKDQQYDKIVGRGERLTSTCTLTFDTSAGQFRPDWTAADETAYKTASDLLDTDANARFRSEDKYNHVYCRFRILDTWNGLEAFETNFVFPKLDGEGIPQPVFHAVDNPTGMDLRVPGLKILRKLPLKERVDYSSSKIDSGDIFTQIAALRTAAGDMEEIAPFFFANINPVGAAEYALLDKLSTATEDAADKDKRRHWAAHCAVVSHQPAIELRVTSNRQTLLALTQFLTPPPDGLWGADWDPEEQRGIDYTTIRGTVCIESEHRLIYTKTMRITVVENRPLRILNLNVPDARRDYVAVDTIVAIEDGAVKTTTSGGYVRDDYPRVKTVVEAAAEWYSRVKRAIEFSYKQPRRLVDIGTLILSSQAMQLTDDINTPVTSITYSMGSGGGGGSTRIETGFAEIDFS